MGELHSPVRWAASGAPHPVSSAREGWQLFGQSTDQDWEVLGQLHPYWAVFTDDAFRQDHLTEAALGRFLDSGEEYVTRVWDIIRARLDAEFEPRRVLD